MASKKSKFVSGDEISYKVVRELSDSMLKLEQSKAKQWLENPELRAEELMNLATEKFPSIWEADSLELVLRVDLDIYFREILISGDEMTVLMTPELALEAFFDLDWDSNPNMRDWFEMLINWVEDFGCIFTRGSGDHVGGWFEDPLWDVLSEIGAYEQN